MYGTSLSSIVIRDARPEEFAAIGALTVAAFEAPRPEDSTPRAVNPERRQALADAGARARDGRLLVAIDALTEQVIGTVALVHASTPSSLFAQHGEAEIRLLAVHPDHRARGVAYGLMRHAIEVADAQGAAAVVLDTGPRNLTAQRLYARLGFERAPERETRPSVHGGMLAVFVLPLVASQASAHALATQRN